MRSSTKLLSHAYSCCRSRKILKVAWRAISTPAVVDLDTDACGTGRIATISLNSASNRNALSVPLLTKLNECLDKLSDERSGCRVLVVRSNVPRVFSSGHDLNELRRGEQLESLFALCADVMYKIHSLPLAVIAEVDGMATAAGCQLAASCDLVVASTNARFATPGVNIGLFCSTPAVALARAVSSHKHAMEMLLTGDVFEVQYAHRVGLVNRIVEPDQLRDEVMHISQKIASKSASSIRLGKKTYQQQTQVTDLKAAYQIASATMVENLSMPDAAEGIHAFLSKRPAKF